MSERMGEQVGRSQRSNINYVTRECRGNRKMSCDIIGWVLCVGDFGYVSSFG